MAHPREPADDDDEPAVRRSSGRHRGRSGGRRPPVRSWDDEAEGSEAGDHPDPAAGNRRGFFHRRDRVKEPVYFRARDSVFFEPLVALAIIVVLLVALFAYTQNWPPMYVVESDSMQHGSDDHVGLINTGDLVLAQKLGVDQIVPYVVGAQSGYQTYGEYGDVILYHPDGDTSGAPIIHRALVYIQINSDGTASVPELAGQPCGSAANAVYSVTTPTGCGTDHVAGGLTLYRVGWQAVTVRVQFADLGSGSGFLTMGDNNFGPGSPPQGDPDQPVLSSLVQPAWIVGAARGMLPWFGAVKLLLEGNSLEVPPQSWQWLGLSLVGLLVAAIAVHFLLRAEGIEDPRRREDERTARSDADNDDDPSPRSWWRRGPRDDANDDEDDDDDPPARGSHRSGARGKDVSRRFGGRPRPDIGRSSRKSRSADDDDDAD